MLGGGWLLTAAPAPAATTTETFEFTGEPTDFGGGGGGGSGFGPAGVAFETGVREGDGVVTITFDPDAAAARSSR
jgi:hypothetical protein